MPPTLIRRPLTIGTWLLMSLVGLALSPVLLLIGELASKLWRRPQPRLLTQFMLAYLTYELLTMLACGGLWLLSGWGADMAGSRMQALHYRLLRWYVRRAAQRVMTLLDITVQSTPSEDVARALHSGRPLLFLSRHAGPGDALLLIDLLMSRYGRLPSVVFKQTLALDPCVDLLGHRLPHALVDGSHPRQCETRIEQVSAAMPPCGALVLFPEGGNLTRERRRRALRRLWRTGRRGEARAAEQMLHLMPPHPGGAVAALRGNPDADVVFSAHTGLGLSAFPRELWRAPPIGKTLRTQMWLAPAAERPLDPDEVSQWLFAWWRRLDDWLEAQGEEEPLSQDTAA